MTFKIGNKVKSKYEFVFFFNNIKQETRVYRIEEIDKNHIILKTINTKKIIWVHVPKDRFDDNYIKVHNIFYNIFLKIRKIFTIFNNKY